MTTELTVTVVVAVAAAAFMIGLAKGGLAGLGPMITVIVALAVPSTVAIGILLPLLMVGDMAALWVLRPHIQWLVVKPVVGGSVLGVGLASFTLASLSPEGLEIGIAAVVLVFTVYRVMVLVGRGPSVVAQSILATDRAGGTAGFVAGITSTVAHAGGPPVAIHLLAREVKPVAYAGTSAAIFWAINWLKVPGYALAGLFDVPLLAKLAPTAVLILPGVLIGRWAVRRLSPRPFEIFVLIGMVAGAILLLVR